MSVNNWGKDFNLAVFMNSFYADDEYIASLYEKADRATKLCGIPNIDTTLAFHLWRFINLTQKSCQERKPLEWQDSRDFNETDDYLRNTYIISGDQKLTVLSLIMGKEVVRLVPTSVAPMGENVRRVFRHNLIGILDY